MAANTFRPPKQWPLTENETITSFANWQSNLLYHLSLCNEFAPYLETVWAAKHVANHGLVGDDDTVAVGDRKTAAQKAIILDRMLGLIAQFAPSLLRKDIIKSSTSLAWIWTRIRRHYGFVQSEVNFLSLSDIKRKDDERFETFFQRILAHLDDNLLTVASNLQHNGVAVAEDEVMSPSTERLAVYLWLTLIDERLPSYVARTYAHELTQKSLKDIQPQLSQSMDALLAELAAHSEIQVHYSRSSYHQRRSTKQNPQAGQSSRQVPGKVCSLCKAANRSYKGHDIASCWYLSKYEKLEMAKALRISTIDSDCDDEEENQDISEDMAACVVSVSLSEEQPDSTTEACPSALSTSVKRVECDISPFFYAFLKHHPVHIIIDTGATSSVVSRKFLLSVGITPQQTSHSAHGADKSKLNVNGEIQITGLTLGNIQLSITALVMDTLDCDILAGIPFCKSNDVHVHMKAEQITIGNVTIPYGAGRHLSRPNSRIRRVDSCVVRNEKSQVVLPGEYVEVSSNDLANFNGEVAIEPRSDSPHSGIWPSPSISRVIQGTIRIPNLGPEPIKLSKSQHIAQIRRVTTPEHSPSMCVSMDAAPDSPLTKASTSDFSSKIHVDPNNILNNDEKEAFCSINRQFDNSFSPNFGVYNDRSGYFRAKLNIGPCEPPPVKGKLPLYGQNDFQHLQDLFDQLESLGVVGKPEDHNVTVKHTSPSFMVKDAKTGKTRLVTAFNSLSPYVRLPPTATFTCEDTLRRLSSFNFLIKTDLTKAFFQMQLSEDSLPYLGTVTPFKGLRIYLRPPMGMPGSSEYLQELLQRICGDFLKEGFLLLNHDDMFVGGDSIQSLLSHWYRLLLRLRENNITLSPSKTYICPQKVTILGWDWRQGTLSPNTHSISALASVSPPKTCTAMRSFIGSFKAISRCIPRYASLVSPLEDAIKGLKGNQLITWSPELLDNLAKAQSALKSPKTITIPKSSDQLVLTVDASPLNKGLGSTLFSQRGGKRLVSGFFSFKLKSHQLNNWYPCEHEALAIASSVKHFAPYIRESAHPLQVLTDSKPCYQAFQRLRAGHFSASARVSTFLSTLSSHNVQVLHIPGKNNTSSDFSSRNPRDCNDESCQVCTYVNNTAASVYSVTTVSDILAGTASMPYKNTSAWKSAQHSCPDLRKTYAHLTQGTRPSRKSRNIRNLRHYLNVATVDKQGLIVVSKADPFVGVRNLIVVPAEILPGLLQSLHLKFEHATKSQLVQLFNRHFFAIKSAPAITQVVESCEQCNSMKKIPRELLDQSSSPSASKPGEVFYADILKRTRQRILVTRDVHSSFTVASIVPDETAESLRNGLIIGTCNIRASSSAIYVDSAPGFKTLKDDTLLKKHGISVEFGRVKNKNAVSVADKSIQELEREMLNVDPSGGPLSEVQLQLVIEVLNTRIRNRGLSAREILFQRDQHTNDQLNINDLTLAQQQNDIREQNHLSSATSKARGNPPPRQLNLKVGELVFIKDEGSKHHARDRYIITNIEGNLASIQKLGKQFMSCLYKVPVSHLYPASSNFVNFYHDWDNIRPASDTDSSDDVHSDTASTLTEDIDDNDDIHEDENIVGEAALTPEVQRRPPRNRQPPAWQRSGDFQM